MGGKKRPETERVEVRVYGNVDPEVEVIRGKRFYLDRGGEEILGRRGDL